MDANDNLYDRPMEEDDAPPPEEQDEHGQEGKTALINSDICPDCKPGDVLQLKVLKVHGEELEVQFMGMGGEEKETPPEMAEKEPETESDSMMA